MSLKISARNQFEGRITALQPGAVNTEVELTLAGGDRIVAVVTQASARDLGLAVGGRAVAIVKAPWVIVAADDSPLKFSARNQLCGTVSEIRSGPVNAEVGIRLPGGVVVHAVITQESVAELGLAPGVPARALVKASHVVLAV